MNEKKEVEVSILVHYFCSHFYPVNQAFYFVLKEYLSKSPHRSPKTLLHSQRVKRLKSIIGKLPRFPNMQISQMQDIAGNRLILESLEELRELEKELESHPLQYFCPVVKRKKNYITKPKEDGYRSLHLVYKLDIESKHIFAPFQVELQLRTKKQHDWATAIEVIDTFHNKSLKQGSKDADWTKFFQETSKLIAKIENNFEETELKKLRQELSEKYKWNIEELRAIQKNAKKIIDERNKQSKGKEAYYHLILIRKIATRRKVARNPPRIF